MLVQESRIYLRAMELSEIVADACRRMPRGHHLRDQLQRACSSVAMQFVEGFGQDTAAHRRHYFVIARGSANEVACALDLARRWRVVDDGLAARGIDAARHVAAMLSKFR